MAPGFDWLAGMFLLLLTSSLLSTVSGTDYPTNRACAAVNASAMQVTWTQASDATVAGYYLDLERTDGVKIEPTISIKLDHITYESYTFYGLGYYGGYTIKIHSYFVAGTNGTDYDLSCLTDPWNPDASNFNFTCIGISYTEITCTWANVTSSYWNGILEGYQIQYVAYDNDHYQFVNVTLSDESYTISGLSFDSWYVIQLRTFNQYGLSPYTSDPAKTLGWPVVNETETRYFCYEAVPGTLVFGWKEMPCTIYVGIILLLLLTTLILTCICCCQCCCKGSKKTNNNMEVNIFNEEKDDDDEEDYYTSEEEEDDDDKSEHSGDNDDDEDDNDKDDNSDREPEKVTDKSKDEYKEKPKKSSRTKSAGSSQTDTDYASATDSDEIDDDYMETSKADIVDEVKAGGIAKNTAQSKIIEKKQSKSEKKDGKFTKDQENKKKSDDAKDEKSAKTTKDNKKQVNKKQNNDAKDKKSTKATKDNKVETNSKRKKQPIDSDDDDYDSDSTDFYEDWNPNAEENPDITVARVDVNEGENVENNGTSVSESKSKNSKPVNRKVGKNNSNTKDSKNIKSGDGKTDKMQTTDKTSKKSEGRKTQSDQDTKSDEIVSEESDADSDFDETDTLSSRNSQHSDIHTIEKDSSKTQSTAMNTNAKEKANTIPSSKTKSGRTQLQNEDEDEFDNDEKLKKGFSKTEKKHLQEVDDSCDDWGESDTKSAVKTKTGRRHLQSSNAIDDEWDDTENLSSIKSKDGNTHSQHGAEDDDDDWGENKNTSRRKSKTGINHVQDVDCDDWGENIELPSTIKSNTLKNNGNVAKQSNDASGGDTEFPKQSRKEQPGKQKQKKVGFFGKLIGRSDTQSKNSNDGKNNHQNNLSKEKVSHIVDCGDWDDDDYEMDNISKDTSAKMSRIPNASHQPYQNRVDNSNNYVGGNSNVAPVNGLRNDGKASSNLNRNNQSLDGHNSNINSNGQILQHNQNGTGYLGGNAQQNRGFVGLPSDESSIYNSNNNRHNLNAGQSLNENNNLPLSRNVSTPSGFGRNHNGTFVRLPGNKRISTPIGFGKNPDGTIYQVPNSNDKTDKSTVGHVHPRQHTHAQVVIPGKSTYPDVHNYGRHPTHGPANSANNPGMEQLGPSRSEDDRTKFNALFDSKARKNAASTKAASKNQGNAASAYPKNTNASHQSYGDGDNIFAPNAKTTNPGIKDIVPDGYGPSSQQNQENEYNKNYQGTGQHNVQDQGTKNKVTLHSNDGNKVNAMRNLGEPQTHTNGNNGAFFGNDQALANPPLHPNPSESFANPSNGVFGHQGVGRNDPFLNPNDPTQIAPGGMIQDPNTLDQTNRKRPLVSFRNTDNKDRHELPSDPAILPGKSSSKPIHGNTGPSNDKSDQQTQPSPNKQNQAWAGNSNSNGTEKGDKRRGTKTPVTEINAPNLNKADQTFDPDRRGTKRPFVSEPNAPSKGAWNSNPSGGKTTNSKDLNPDGKRGGTNTPIKEIKALNNARLKGASPAFETDILGSKGPLHPNTNAKGNSNPFLTQDKSGKNGETNMPGKGNQNSGYKPIKADEVPVKEAEPVFETNRLGKKYPFLRLPDAPGNDNSETLNDKPSKPKLVLSGREMVPVDDPSQKKFPSMPNTLADDKKSDTASGVAAMNIDTRPQVFYGFGVGRWRLMVGKWLNKWKMKKRPVKTVEASWD